MPPAPELPYVFGKEGLIEILFKMNAEHLAYAGGDVDISRKFGIELNGKGKRAQNDGYPAVRRIVSEYFADDRAETVGDDKNFEQPPKPAQKTAEYVFRGKRRALRQLGAHFVVPPDRALRQLGKEADE